MKLSFNSITLGGGPNYFLDNDLGKGLDPTMKNNVVRIPRTDYSKGVSIYVEPCVRAFSGTMLGTDQIDFRERKRALIGMIGTTFEFILTDDYTDSAGNATTFAQYSFTGKIVAVSANEEAVSNSSKFQIQVYCEDPNLYLLPGYELSEPITVDGFVFPLGFPLTFDGAMFELVNSGFRDIYPQIIIRGTFTNLRISMSNYALGMVNNTLTYTGTITDPDYLVITPIPTDPIKIVDSTGDSKIANTNANWDAVTIKPGTNFLSISADSIDGATAEITYKIPYLGI